MRISHRIRFAVAAVAAVALCFGLAACSSTPKLNGKTLNIYCGAGMTKPFAEISEAFQTSTGCEMVVTYANAAQIQTQIKTTEQGDFFIAGSAEELKPVEGYVASSTDLVKHIPVLVVPADNPANVAAIADLANCDRVLVGDPESTPIGKIAKNIMSNAGIWDDMMSDGKLTTTTTAPQISTALANGEGQAGIVWKENTDDKVKIIDTPEMQKAIKTIPAAQLTSCADQDTAKAFLNFLKSDTATQIWKKYGYELVS